MGSRFSTPLGGRWRRRRAAGSTIRSCLAFVHIRILSAKPDKYPYPHPDVLQVVYVARGLPGSFVGTDPDGWEESVEFVAPDDLKERPLGENELIYLNEGLRLLDAV